MLGLGSLLGSSCVVDRSDLTFDDDEYQAALGSGGKKGSGGDGGDGGDGAGSGGDAGGGNTNTGGAGGEVGTGGMGGDDGVCEANSMQCNGRQVELCANAQWIPIGGECPHACVDGACTGMCVPDSDECLSGIQTQHCNDVGQWEADFCEFACVDGTCGGVCRPGDRDCNGKTRTLCGEDGQWADQSTCPGDCEGGVCVGACTVGETQCAGTAEDPVVVTCDGISWETSPETPCEFICTEGDCGGECTPFSSECVSGSEVRVCDSTATWGTAQGCPFICDSATGACGGECVPGTKRCSSTTVQTCDANGKWVNSTTCDGNTPVCLEATAGAPKCVECAPGAKQCDPTANGLFTCSAEGSWPTSSAYCKPLKGGEETVCWKDSRGVAACIGISEICPELCLKGCPSGCIDKDTRWYCSSGNVKAANCTSGLLCNAGVCK